MQITLETSGGFMPAPGLRTPIRIDTERLDPALAGELGMLIAAAKFFDRPEGAGAAPPGSADLITYAVTITDGARQHTVRAVDPLDDPAIRQLIERLRSIGPTTN